MKFNKILVLINALSILLNNYFFSLSSLPTMKAYFITNKTSNQYNFNTDYNKNNKVF